MYSFATFFDINYLSRGLALLDSLTTHSSKSFKLHVLALDEEVVNYFKKHPAGAINVITLSEIEAYFPELAEAKNNRSKVEYYFTLSPYLPIYILEKFQDVKQITTMDADLYFYNDPAIILEKYPDASVLITPHDFSHNLLHLKVYGEYNVSFQSFKNDENARLCLQDWRQNCFEWCHDYYDAKNNRFADQKYLDTWNRKFKNVQDIEIPGAGLAPWNVEKHNYEIISDELLVDGEPLIYFHFHHLRIFNKNFAFNGLEHYSVQPRTKAIKYIYHSYLKKLKAFSNQQPDRDKHIIRDNKSSNDKLQHKLRNSNGYWFFTNSIIVHVNLHRWYLRFKRNTKFAWLT